MSSYIPCPKCSFPDPSLDADTLTCDECGFNPMKRIEELEALVYAEDGEKYSVKWALEVAENKRLRDAVYLMRLRAYELGVPDVGDIGDRALSGEVNDE